MSSGRTGRPPHDDALTPAEWRVVDGVRHGLSNPAIAARLEVSVDAVKFHVGNALAKLGFADRSELRLWNGIRKDSKLAEVDGKETSSLRLGPIGQVAWHVRDVERAARWFEDALGLVPLYRFADMAFFDCGGVRLFVTKGDPARNLILYFRVDDIAGQQERLASRKVEIVAAPHRIHVHADGSEEWMCFFRDPDGGTLALMKTTSGREDAGC